MCTTGAPPPDRSLPAHWLRRSASSITVRPSYTPLMRPPVFVAPLLRQHSAEPCTPTHTIVAQPPGGRPEGTAHTTPQSSVSSALVIRLAAPSQDASWSQKGSVALFICATLRYALRRWMVVPQRGGATMAISVQGAHFPQDLMRMGVRWYLTSPLRYRQGEPLLTECRVRRDHATIM